ncbi:MAG: hypothetical protein IH851_06205 [Armatimonadetes bacterium]|nr:hypothetical protein [Armatimonadota bacterium]
MRSLALILAAALACAAFADSNRRLPGRRLAAPPVIDGVVSLDEWSAAASSEGFVDRFTDRETEFKTSVFAGYDDRFLYFGFICFDPDPSRIRATEYRLEGNLSGDDRLTIRINPFGTFRRDDFNRFQINPRGATKADFAGGRAAKREWRGAWSVAARITERGWEAELRIPWDILRLPPAGVRDLTLNFDRVVPRAQQETQWSSLGPSNLEELHGVWTQVDVPAAASAAVLQALPYQILGGDQNGAMVFNTGVDFRQQFPPQLDALGTINPDFENVEGAILGIEFSRFERLTDERRPFFTEGEEFFRMGGFGSRMFAPQRIGMIDFGAKLFGKISDEENIGALFTSQLGSEIASVLRYQRTWGAKASVTGLHTHYDAGEGLRNDV